MLNVAFQKLNCRTFLKQSFGFNTTSKVMVFIRSQSCLKAIDVVKGSLITTYIGVTFDSFG